MRKNIRVTLAVFILIIIVGVVLGVEVLRRRQIESKSLDSSPAGSIPILLSGKVVARFAPGDLEDLGKNSFVDKEEGKTQEGWMLRDILLIYIDEAQLQSGTEITVSSSSRAKSESLRWDSIQNSDNMVMFDISGRGTLKLVSNMEGLNTRDDWVQDVDQIEIYFP